MQCKHSRETGISETNLLIVGLVDETVNLVEFVGKITKKTKVVINISKEMEKKSDNVMKFCLEP